MSDSADLFRMFSPEKGHRLNEQKQRRRSVSTSLPDTTTPSVKSLSFLESNDSSFLAQTENPDLQSAYDKLNIWKRAMEKHLNRVYLQKLKEIDEFLSAGQTDVDVIFGPIPAFEQLALVTSRPPSVDQSMEDIFFDFDNCRSYDLNSNNVLVCASDLSVLIYDNVKCRLVLYDENSCQGSFIWDLNEHGEPGELTYSPYLEKFCIVTNRGLFLWSNEDPLNPQLIEQIKPVGKNRLWSVASTEARPDVFLLFKLGTYVERWMSSLDGKSWRLVQRWLNHDLFERNDQRIRTIRMTPNYVAWTVETMSTFKWRVDLLDYNLQIIRTGIEIDHLYKSSSCLLSNFLSEQFIIIDSNCHSLFFLDSQGLIRLKEESTIRKRIKNAVMMKRFDQSYLVIRLEQPNQLHFIPLSSYT